MRTVLIALTFSVAVCAMAQDTWEARRARLGSRQQPYRILVDKVLMLANDWVMTPEHVAEVREAGSNVVVPRIGAEDALVARAARMAEDQGMLHMPRVRGASSTRPTHAACNRCRRALPGANQPQPRSAVGRLARSHPVLCTALA